MNIFKELRKGIIFFTILLIMCVVIQKILVPKDIDRVSFVEYDNIPKDKLDVLYFGDSSIYSAVNPYVIWEEYGISSYSQAGVAEPINNTYHVIKDSLKIQKPKLILLNADAFFHKKKKNIGYLHLDIDHKKLNIEKLKMIYDENNLLSDREKIEFLIPLYRYHGRWKKLEKIDIGLYDKGNDVLRGHIFRTNYTDVSKKEKLKSKKKVKIPYYNKYIVHKIAELTKKKDIELVIVYIPHLRSYTPQKAKVVKKFAKELGVDFIDLNDAIEEIGLNFSNEFTDFGTHINMKGAVKVSSYLGKILKERYKIPDRKGVKGYEFWERDYNDYKRLYKDNMEILKNNIKNKKQLKKKKKKKKKANKINKEGK